MKAFLLSFTVLSAFTVGCASKDKVQGFDSDFGDVIQFHVEDSSEANAKILLRAKVGDKVKLRWNNDLGIGRRTTYRVHLIQTERQIHFAYIFLDGSKLTLAHIDSLRDVIIAQLEQGVGFDTLAARYSMDGNKTGELPWRNEEVYIPEFYTAVRPHKKGDIFKVDEPSVRWYHVVKKLDEDRLIPVYVLHRL